MTARYASAPTLPSTATRMMPSPAARVIKAATVPATIVLTTFMKNPVLPITWLRSVRGWPHGEGRHDTGCIVAPGSDEIVSDARVDAEVAGS